MYAVSFDQVGMNILKVLESKSMTQQSLADALGISKQVVNKIIKGSKAINVYEISCIASILGVSTDSLLMASEEDSPSRLMVYMGALKDEETRKKVDLLRSAIDEILFLEELLDE